MARPPLFVAPLDLGTIATGNARTGYPATNLGRLTAAGLVWKSNGNSNLWVRGDMGAVQDIDFCAVLSANALATTTIRLRLGDTQGEVDGTADYDSGAVDFISPAITSANGLYHSHLELPSVQTKRWWRLDFGGHSGDLQAALVVLGRSNRMTRFPDRGHEGGIADTGDTSITRHGVWDAKPGAILRTKNFTLSWVSAAEWENGLRPLIEAAGTSHPVYCCFDPAADTLRQGRTYYGRLSKAPFARAQRKPNVFGIDFNFESLI